MSESMIQFLVQFGVTIAGFVGVGMVANYRIGRSEEALKEMAHSLAAVTSAIATKSEFSAREHQEFRSNIEAVTVRQDDQRDRMNDHGRRLDDHGHRITKLEVRA